MRDPVLVDDLAINTQHLPKWVWCESYLGLHCFNKYRTESTTVQARDRRHACEKLTVALAC